MWPCRLLAVKRSTDFLMVHVTWPRDVQIRPHLLQMTLTDLSAGLRVVSGNRATPFSLLCIHTMPHQEFFLLQEENRPVGGFSLRGSLVSALEDNGVPAGKVQLRAGLQASGCSPPVALSVAPCRWTERRGLNETVSVR